jgi:hypothetical protein
MLIITAASNNVKMPEFDMRMMDAPLGLQSARVVYPGFMFIGKYPQGLMVNGYAPRRPLAKAIIVWH